MKLGSLFDGSGTAPLAATLLGWTPVWASEIEPYPVAVTTARFPDMQHLGDITQINGAEIEPVDAVVAGSPCQDLSVAGKQAGLQQGSRSHLFYQMTRIVREMREATNGQQPRFVVWENVPGAFSSNQGRDFLAVVQEFCALADSTVSIPEPESDKAGQLVWRNAGAVMGNGWSFAWRVLNAQYWGVPQRRRRIFAILDLSSERAGEILFERTRLPWNPEPGGWAREEAAVDAVGRADRGSGNRVIAFHRTQDPIAALECTPCMGVGGRGDGQIAVVYPEGCASALRARHDSSPCIDRGQPFVAMFSGGQGMKAGGIGYSEETSPTLKSVLSGGNTVPTVVIQGDIARGAHMGQNGIGFSESGASFALNTIDVPAVVYGVDARNGALNDEIAPTMQAKSGGGQSLNCMPPVLYRQLRDGDFNEPDSTASTLRSRAPHDRADVICVAHGQANAEIAADLAPTLNCNHEQPIVYARSKPPRRYIVRRLIPLECSRLQGFPDWWTDEVQGSDSAQYKMWGNGMALPCMLAVLTGIDKTA